MMKDEVKSLTPYFTQASAEDIHSRRRRHRRPFHMSSPRRHANPPRPSSTSTVVAVEADDVIPGYQWDENFDGW